MLNFNFSDFSTWISMVMFISMWNLGFVAITRKGKIGYFLLEFFERTRPVYQTIDPKFKKKIVNQLVDTNMLEIRRFPGEPSYAEIQEINEALAAVLKSNDVFVNDLQLPGLCAMRVKQTVSWLDDFSGYEFYCETQEDVYPDWIKDPLIVCITCLASFHGTILYSSVVYFRHWHWNFFELITIIIPVAFVGELFWKLKTALDKSILSGK